MQSNDAFVVNSSTSSSLSELRRPRGLRRRSIKRRLTVTLPGPLLDRLRNAVYWTPHLTVAGLVEIAVAAKLDEIERKNGEPFPVRPEELKGGRPRLLRSDPCP